MNYSDCMNPPCQQHSEWEESGQLKVWNHTWIFSEGCFQLLIMLSCTLLASEPEHFSMCVEHRGHISTHIYREREREREPVGEDQLSVISTNSSAILCRQTGSQCRSAIHHFLHWQTYWCIYQASPPPSIPGSLRYIYTVSKAVLWSVKTAWSTLFY